MVGIMPGVGAPARPRQDRRPDPRARRRATDHEPSTFAAFTAETTDDGFRRGVTELHLDDLPDGDVLVDVEWSSVNYKDALAATEKGRVARISPLVPGIDLAGTVRESTVDGVAVGDAVIAHGYDLGVAHHGGYAQVARCRRIGSCRCPTAHDARVDGDRYGRVHRGVVGAGVARPRHHAGRGHGAGDGRDRWRREHGGGDARRARVHRGREHRQARGRRVPPRARRARDRRPRRADRREQAVAEAGVGGRGRRGRRRDARGRARVLAQFGAVAASGNVGGADLPTTVLPFILRGVTLYGIDSAHTPIGRRREVWGRIATDLKPAGLERGRTGRRPRRISKGRSTRSAAVV